MRFIRKRHLRMRIYSITRRCQLGTWCPTCPPEGEAVNANRSRVKQMWRTEVDKELEAA